MDCCTSIDRTGWCLPVGSLVLLSGPPADLSSSERDLVVGRLTGTQRGTVPLRSPTAGMRSANELGSVPTPLDAVAPHDVPHSETHSVDPSTHSNPQKEKLFLYQAPVGDPFPQVHLGF